MSSLDIIINILNQKAQTRSKKIRVLSLKKSLSISYSIINFYLSSAIVPTQLSILNLRSSLSVYKSSKIDNLRAYLLWLIENDHLSDENFYTINLALQRVD